MLKTDWKNFSFCNRIFLRWDFFDVTFSWLGSLSSGIGDFVNVVFNYDFFSLKGYFSVKCLSWYSSRNFPDEVFSTLIFSRWELFQHNYLWMIFSSVSVSVDLRFFPIAISEIFMPDKNFFFAGIFSCYFFLLVILLNGFFPVGFFAVNFYPLNHKYTQERTFTCENLTGKKTQICTEKPLRKIPPNTNGTKNTIKKSHLIQKSIFIQKYPILKNRKWKYFHLGKNSCDQSLQEKIKWKIGHREKILLRNNLPETNPSPKNQNGQILLRNPKKKRKNTNRKKYHRNNSTLKKMY